MRPQAAEERPATDDEKLDALERSMSAPLAKPAPRIAIGGDPVKLPEVAAIVRRLQEAGCVVWHFGAPAFLGREPVYFVGHTDDSQLVTELQRWARGGAPLLRVQGPDLSAWGSKDGSEAGLRRLLAGAKPYQVPPGPDDEGVEKETDPSPGKDPQTEGAQPSGPAFYLQSAADFLAEQDPPEVNLVDQLIPAGVVALLHGEPRARKTWAALSLAVAVASGLPAFGLERFRVPRAVPVLYSSQEDTKRRVRVRLRRLLRGCGIQTAPSLLTLSVHAGINLEDSGWQDALISDVRSRGIKLVIFDPIRRYSPNVDKGPAEVRELTAFLRRLVVETGCTVLVVHHDVKPPKEGVDQRRRGHRASGGDWFAASDAPIHAEPAGRNASLIVGQDYKHSDDPQPFVVRLEEDDARTWIRLVGEDVAAGDADKVGLHELILEHLANAPGASGNAVAKGLKKGKQAVLDALAELLARNLVDCTDEGRKRCWFLRPKDQRP